jgi:hypothetical protein
MKKILLSSLIFTVISGFSSENFNTIYQADLPNKALDISYSKDGKIIQVTSNKWTDRVKTKQGQVYRTFVQGYNYEKKKGFTRVFDAKGELVEENWDKKINGMVTREEIFIAFDLFKNNSTVKNHFKETQLQITIHGGFDFEDQSECKVGNRCVHVFASTPKVAILAHSIVRLTDSKVVYENYDMDKNVWKNGHAKNKFK